MSCSPAQQDTACQYCPELWTCGSITRLTHESIVNLQATARRLCFRCPLIRECADYALAQAEEQNEKWQGMIIGGIAVPDANHRSNKFSVCTLVAWDSIRRGEPLDDVHAGMHPATLPVRHQQLARDLNAVWRKDNRHERVGR